MVTDSVEIANADPIIVVGGGMAAWRFVDQLVSLGVTRRHRVEIIGEEKSLPYDRVHLGRVFEGSPYSSLELRSRGWYEDNDIRVHTCKKIVSIDRERRRILDANGVSMSYGTLALATGSSPRLPEIEGITCKNVFVYRTFEDVEKIQRALASADRALVVGGGLLGIEAADLFHAKGVETTIVQAANALLCRQLNEEASGYLLKAVAQHGIQTRLQTRTQSIREENGRLKVEFDRGAPLAVDLVVIAAGVTPRDELARDCGLAVGGHGGILVDDELRTEDSSIFAIGECASYRGASYGLVAPCYAMADCLARNFAGRHGRFEGADMSCRLKTIGVEVSVFGDYLQEGVDYIYRSETEYRSLVVRSGHVIGGTVVGAYSGTNRIERAVRERMSVSERVCMKFARTGEFELGGAEASIALWPESAIVCNCVNVTCGTIRSALNSGCADLQSVQTSTGAGTVCGSCVGQISEFLGMDPAETSDFAGLKGAVWVWRVSLVAMVVAIALIALPGAPAAESVEDAYYQLSQIWSSSLSKQISGYTLVGLSIAALGLSARKRLRKFSVGNYGYWRAAHTILGTGTLIGLIAHTGFHSGSNLNFWLFVCFLSLNLAGVATAMIVSKSERFSDVIGRRIRRWATLAHIALFAPYPVLVGIHIAKFYRY